jgi:hypothetical protein
VGTIALISDELIAIQNGKTIDIVRIKDMKVIKNLNPKKGWFSNGFEKDTCF